LLFDILVEYLQKNNGGISTMINDKKEPKVKTLCFRLPKKCVCPDCGKKQRFKKFNQHYKFVKKMDLNQEILLKVRVVNAKCLNPECSRKSFQLPIPEIERYQRAHSSLKREAVAGIVQDNSTLIRISKRLNRSFNTTGSKSSIDRWKKEQAQGYNIKDIITKLDFSGILSIDEYKPKRSLKYDIIASDGAKGHILYIDEIEKRNSMYLKLFLEKLKGLLPYEPFAVIFDLWKPYPGAAKKVFKNAIIQYDYFHIMKTVHWHLRNALAQYRKSLKEQGWPQLNWLLWKNKWTILKNQEKRSQEQKEIIANLRIIFKDTIVEDILDIKERIRDIFINSESKEKAIEKRDSLIQDYSHIDNIHFRRILKFFKEPNFNYMTNFLVYAGIPRSGNSEVLIRSWRQMEKVRYGFKTREGRLNHLKLYQIYKYLDGNIS